MPNFRQHPVDDTLRPGYREIERTGPLVDARLCFLLGLWIHRVDARVWDRALVHVWLAKLMLLRGIGSLVARHGRVIVALWGLMLLLAVATAPAWQDVVRYGEFAFLPDDSPSRIAESEYREAFTHDLLGSTAVVVVQRAGREDGLLPQDHVFVETILKPELERIARFDPEASTWQRKNEIPQTPIRNIRTASDRMLGGLLIDDEHKTSLVLIELTTPFQAAENQPLLRKIETRIAQEGELVDHPQNLFAQRLVPPGLSLSLSGAATVGRDLQRNSRNSTLIVLQWVVLATAVGLLVFCRAPLFTLAPLISLGVGTWLTVCLTSQLAEWGWLVAFVDLEKFLLVLLPSAAMLPTLMLLSRISECRDRFPTLEQALSEAIRKAGPSLFAAWGITMLCFGLFLFSQFGKFRHLGWVLLIGSCVMGLATLSLMPSLIAICGRWSFWPYLRTAKISPTTWSVSRQRWSVLHGGDRMRQLLESTWRQLATSPRAILLGVALVLGPLALLGAFQQSHLTHDLLAQLPTTESSVKGALIINEQFPGTIGPVTLLISSPDVPFDSVAGKESIAALSDQLEVHSDRYGIFDIRSVAYPLGWEQKDVGMDSFFGRALRHRKAVEYYVGNKPPIAANATKLEIVFRHDPYSRKSLQQFERLRQEFSVLLPSELTDAEWHFLGGPASIRDLEAITQKDRRLSYGWGTVAVFAVLLLFWRQPGLSVFVIGLGVVSFLAAVGTTAGLLWLWDADSFAGLDWKIPQIAFFLQIALVAQAALIFHWRVRAETEQHPLNDGLRIAWRNTARTFWGSGWIITALSAALIGSSLVSLRQLGWTLASGAAFTGALVVPILMPTGLLLLRKTQPETDEAPDEASLKSTTPMPEIPVPPVSESSGYSS